tara:strand:- start:26 stop:229 length:204 start_codon:yes stop_codon:yes gene_type:complete
VEKNFPEYLISEPFWNETIINTHNRNLFEFLKFETTPVLTWLDKIKLNSKKTDNLLRKKEIEFIKNI